MDLSFSKNLLYFVQTYLDPGVIIWLWMELILILILFLVFTSFPKSSFVIFFDLVFEKVYDFFEDLLWNEEKRWIKLYVTLLFFIIIFSNFLWVFLEFLTPIFGHTLESLIKIPTADINFNIAMAIIWVLIVICEQFKFLWFKSFIFEYFPILWKDYIPFTRWNLPKIIDFPVFLLVKFFDIVISLFLWILEIIWIVAKVISLSFRLFWNITSGGILLAMLMWALWAFTLWILNFEFPVVFPLIVYLQEILVACIQAFVFPLLIAIFIKVAKIH